jgi:ATP-dependent Clp protease ATP-binding subunit ClpC
VRLADELYPSAAGASLLRIDLSEYGEPHSVSRLLGAPPGYVGYGEGGQLTEAVRRRPASVVLLDEVDKAHPAVVQTLLPILEEGCATDGRGRRVDFTSAVVVLTSNLGASVWQAGGRAVGFGGGALDAAARDSERALDAARAALPPELWARIDERLVFAPLQKLEVARIAELLLEDSSRRLWAERQIAFKSGPGLVELLIAAGGFQAQLGARPMRQIIQRLVESPLADAILRGQVQPGERLLLCAEGGAVELRREA